VSGRSCVEEALEQLQQLARLPGRPRELEERFRWGQIPADLCDDKDHDLVLTDPEFAAFEYLNDALPDDQRFEYMDKRAVDAAAWRYVCLVYMRPDENHVERFISEHAQPLRDLTCYFPVELLKVSAETQVHGVRLIPAENAELPERLWAPDPRPTMASVIAVECTGTSYAKMMIRAREVAEHALRLLRVGLREHHTIHDDQLRFRLGVGYWFSDTASGWQRRRDEGFPFELTETMREVAMSPAIASLPPEGCNDIERCANLALKWFERSQLETDSLMRLLFLFFALEAILGNKAEGRKARGLAIRRSILGERMRQGFPHPALIYLLYDQVRSVAVHGGNPPNVPEDEIDKFSWDVRWAINEFLGLADKEGLSKRGRLLATLDSDPNVAAIEEGFLPDD
jgi:hypothetical protein